MRSISVLLILGIILLSTACQMNDRIRLCEEENPAFDPSAECQKVMHEKYPDKACTFTLGKTEWLPMGSCRDCTISCR